jgi:hypothetical protein
MYANPKRRATERAAVLLPEPAGPSMAMMILFCSSAVIHVSLREPMAEIPVSHARASS